jgi:2-polyprenyl-6-hydroxyphenyl methylase/3-demethylubiquinone-9 3-methyltransferase
MRGLTAPGLVLKLVDSTPCKCCGADALSFGAVDFNKSCEDHRRKPLPVAGVDVPYHRCPRCGFVFTVAFDDLSGAAFQEHIYNAQYELVDPDFVDHRPRNNAAWVDATFLSTNRSARCLDYGGGNGLLAMLLRDAGSARAESYDPFYDAVRPTGRFDLVTCFEVLEHTARPYETLRDVRSLLDDRGLLVFSTLLQPVDFERQGLAWWYAAPRNGHVSLYTRASLTALMKRLGLKWGSFNDHTHVAFRTKPSFAKQLIVA